MAFNHEWTGITANSNFQGNHSSVYSRVSVRRTGLVASTSGAFSINRDEVFCCEACENANGLLAHLDNVGALLEGMLTMADLTRVKVHGMAEEFEKMKAPLAHF